MGVYYIKIKKQKIKDFDPDYPKDEYLGKNHNLYPIIISNHISSIDTILLTHLY